MPATAPALSLPSSASVIMNTPAKKCATEKSKKTRRSSASRNSAAISMTDTVSAGEEVTALKEDGTISVTLWTKHAAVPVITASQSVIKNAVSSPSVATAVTAPHKSSAANAMIG